MYKIIFIDLDGTLLNDKKEISDENIKQLNRAYNEKGIKTIKEERYYVLLFIKML